MSRRHTSHYDSDFPLDTSMNQRPPDIRCLSPKIDESAIDKSAIDDDDNWEDAVEESGKPSVDEKLQFHRVYPNANLTSRPSLITLMAKKAQNQSQSTSALINPNGLSLVALPNDVLPTAKSRSRVLPTGPLNKVSRSNPDAEGLSPRTIRHNMIANELSEYREQLLRERDQNSLCCISKDGATYKEHRPLINTRNLDLNGRTWDMGVVVGKFW